MTNKTDILTITSVYFILLDIGLRDLELLQHPKHFKNQESS